MATQVILLERIEKLGKMGDVVAVKPGYARNYLLPQKKALRATKDNIAYFDTQRKHLEGENEKRRKEAEKVAKTLDGLKVAIIRQASEGGQLYGSVSSRDIAAQIAEVSGQKVERNMVEINLGFKTIGLLPVKIALHPEVKIEVIVNIARSPEEAEIQEKTGRALIADDSQSSSTARKAPEAEEDLSGVLEEDALQARKQREAEDSEEQQQEDEKAAAKKAKRAKKPKKEKGEEADREEDAEAEDEE